MYVMSVIQDWLGSATVNQQSEMDHLSLWKTAPRALDLVATTQCEEVIAAAQTCRSR